MAMQLEFVFANSVEYEDMVYITVPALLGEMAFMLWLPDQSSKPRLLHAPTT
jgi:hypothetical protein